MRNIILKIVLVLTTASYTLAANSFNEGELSTTKEIQCMDSIYVIAVSDSLFLKGKLLYNEKEYTKAIGYFLKSDSVINVHFGTESPYYGYGNMWVSCCYHNLNMDSVAIKFSEYYDLQPIDKMLTHSSDSVICVALEMIEMGQINNAADKLFEASNLEKQELGANCYWYANTLSNCAALYNELGIFEKAIKLGEEAADIFKTNYGIDHPVYATYLNNLATFYADYGNNFIAIQLVKEALEIKKKFGGIENSDYSINLSNLADFYSKIGNYTEALIWGKEAMEIKKRLFGTEHPDYAFSLINLANIYTDMGNCTEALQLGIKAMEILKNVHGSTRLDYAMSLSCLASFYSDIGNDKKALQLGLEALKIRKEVLGIEHPLYALSLSHVALYNSYLDNNAAALQIGKEVVELYKKFFGTEHTQYAASLSCLAYYYSKEGNYVKAILIANKALEIWQKVYGSEHPGYANMLNSLAKYNAALGNYSEALLLGKESVKIMKQFFGTEHPDYATLLSNIASFYSQIGYYAEAYNYLKQHIDGSQSYILKRFFELSSALRESLWNGKFSSYYIREFPSIVEKYKNKESISELYDKTCLFAKGILLNTDMVMRKLILESGNSSLIAKYNNLSSNISIYNKLIETPIDKRFVNSDSLNNVIQRLEMELAKESKAYGDYTHNLTINWKDVQRGLDDNDIAIEFLDFPIYNSDSTMYVALTLKKKYDSPHMVTLFKEKQLKAISVDVYYTKTDIANLVWKPLEEELIGVKNIYFAPSGELHRIGIEYLPISETKNICDVYTLHRLSSTRQLALIQDETEGKNNILYGGLDYDEKSDAISTDSVSTKESVLKSAFSRANVDSLSLRSSFEYLEGTKKEADMIAEDMKQHRVPYIYYSGIDGTEESFKKLEGARPKLIHIATHGFFLTEAEAEKAKFVRPEIELMTEGGQKAGRYVEDKPMTRSGLLFSGCNHAIHHEQIPDGEEDGILTAQEISMLDLRGLDLVVLSACQTGLGDVISGEGVFGLQRGFKKAGAKTILMSLDKVNDEATRILMVEFYRNLMNGKTKRQSLQEAQQHLRKVENGKYDDPKYWASFIMLDGLN